MDIMQLLGSVNKISLIAFFIVLMFMLYELYLINKEKKRKEKPNIPQFNPNLKIEGQTAEDFHKGGGEEKAHRSYFDKNMTIFVVLFIILIFLGVITFSGYFLTASKETKPTVIVNEINSKGIKLFDKDWKEIGETAIQPGKDIIISIENIDGVGIDRARIRINDNQWQLENITNQFNKEKKVWYKEYKVATGEEKLKIDAELHSEQDGWLGD
jgi:hypothetical protein